MICLLNRANRRSALRSGKALGDSSTSLSLSLFLLLSPSFYSILLVTAVPRLLYVARTDAYDVETRHRSKTNAIALSRRGIRADSCVTVTTTTKEEIFIGDGDLRRLVVLAGKTAVGSVILSLTWLLRYCLGARVRAEGRA